MSRSGLKEVWGFSWQEEARRHSGAPAVGCCLFFLSDCSGLEGYWGSSCRLEGFWSSICQVLSVLFVCSFQASSDTRAPAVGYCLFFSGLKGGWCSRCRVLSVRFLSTVRDWRDTWAPDVGYCRFFCVCSFRASRDPGGPSVGCGLFFLSLLLFFSGPKGYLGSSCRYWGCICRVLSVLGICSLRASKDPAGQAVGYCLGILTILFRPRDILGLQLSSAVSFLCQIFSGLRGYSGPDYDV